MEVPLTSIRYCPEACRLRPDLVFFDFDLVRRFLAMKGNLRVSSNGLTNNSAKGYEVNGNSGSFSVVYVLAA